jgi:ubiquinone biosynthesis monooxygenase Coq6
MPDDYASMVWSTTPANAKKLLSLPAQTFVSLVNAAFRVSHIDLKYIFTEASPEKIEEEIAWSESRLKADENTFPPRVVSVEEPSRAAFPLKLSHVDEYTAERIALIGDAAHTVHPLAGQGLNLGLADVMSLCSAIEESVAFGSDIGMISHESKLTIGSVFALAKFPLERYGLNHRMLGVCDKLHKLYSQESGPATTLRSWGLEAVNEIGSLKRLIVQNASR